MFRGRNTIEFILKALFGKYNKSRQTLYAAGMPQVCLDENGEFYLNQCGGTKIEISLSHCKAYAVATAVIETSDALGTALDATEQSDDWKYAVSVDCL